MFLAAMAVFQTDENGLRNVSWLPFLQAETEVTQHQCAKRFAMHQPTLVPKLSSSSHSKELLVVIQVDLTTPIGWCECLQRVT